MAVHVTTELDGLQPILAMLNGLGQPRRLAQGLAHVGGLLVSQTQERFADSGPGPDREAWAEWSPAYADTRTKGKSLLQATGAFRDSLAWDLTDTELRVGSNMVFAALHQFGGTDDMAPGPAAVPARPYLGLSDANATQIEDAMGDWIEGLTA